MRRLLLAMSGAIALIACQPDAEPAPDPAIPPSGALVESGLPAGAVRPAFTAAYLEDGSPPWLQIMRNQDGAFIQYSPASLYRYPEQNLAEVWIQIIHRQQQTQAIVTQTGVDSLDYSRERFHYLLDCQNEQFTILERQLVAGDTPFWTFPLDERAEPDWRPIVSTGPAGVLKPPLCDAA